MLNLKAISSFYLAIFFLACFWDSATAGIEPSPLKSKEGKLEAEINNLGP